MNRTSEQPERNLRGSHRFRIPGLAGMLLCYLALPLAAQQQPTFSTNVNVVNVFATVRNKQGKIISNLTKDDFTLEEDGHPQTIRYFATETDLPLTLGLLVDTSLSQARLLEEERDASYAFLDDVLREDKDLAFLIHFDEEVELLQDLTSSRQKLQAALDLLRTPQPVEWQQRGGGVPGTWPGGGPSPWPGTQPWPAPGPGPIPDPGPRGGGSRRRGMSGGTNLYDAVYLASNEIMRKQPGRKALIILSDGVDTGSQVSLVSALEAAERADTLVYSILFVDEQAYQAGGGFGFPGGGMGRRGGMGGYPPEMPNGRAVLDRLARSTGGRLFEVSKKQTLGQIYSSIEEELRNQYSIGYTPERLGADTGYHRIRLTTKQKDLIVQSREGYYSQP
jgi:VWFA-related protein